MFRHGIVVTMLRDANGRVRGMVFFAIFSSLSVCTAVPLAHADDAVLAPLPSPDALLNAPFFDLADKPVALRSSLGKVVVVVHQDRHSSEQNPQLKDKLSALVARFPKELQVVALADVGGYDFWPAKGYVKDALRSLDSGGGAIVACDWKGTVRKAYRLKTKQSVVFVLGKSLELLRMTHGQLSASETEQVVQQIEVALGK